MAKDRGRIGALLDGGLKAINVGLPLFVPGLAAGGADVVHVDWRPPAGGDPALLEALDGLRGRGAEAAAWREPISEANREAMARLLAARPTLVGIGVAIDVVPGMTSRTLLHAGPPVTWARMCGPMRGAVIGGLLYEGLAKTPEEAEALAASGEVSLAPCHHHNAVGPMAGVLTASMPVWIVENTAHGNRAFCTLNEGLGAVLRYGAYGTEVIAHLEWMRDALVPILSAARARHGPIDLRRWLANALHMGDEGHNRNRAATSLLVRDLAGHIASLAADRDEIGRVFAFLRENDHFALNLTMPAAKCALDAAAGVEASSLVTTMSRNGTEFGIRVSGLGDRWFTAPAPRVDGLYLPGFSEEDAAPDIGDSAITETAGYGGFAMAAAPAIVRFVGGSARRALELTERMYEITLAEHDAYQVPALDFRGTPVGIDVLAVADTGIVPVINTGIAHREPGIGMVGAGLVTPPISCFLDAARALAGALEGSD